MSFSYTCLCKPQLINFYINKNLTHDTFLKWFLFFFFFCIYLKITLYHDLSSSCGNTASRVFGDKKKKGEKRTTDSDARDVEDISINNIVIFPREIT